MRAPLHFPGGSFFPDSSSALSAELAPDFKPLPLLSPSYVSLLSKPQFPYLHNGAGNAPLVG